MSATIAAVDMGGTNIKACLFKGEQLEETVEAPSEAELGGVHLLSRAASLLDGFAGFDALGVSTAGQPDPRTGVIRYANSNIPDYTGIDVRSYFERAFGVPAAVVNDVNAAALGEGAYGAARNERDYICLTFGTGVGGGVVLDKKLYYGRGASAGVMLGGLVVHSDRLDPYDPFAGAYERCASATALVKSARMADPSIENGRDVFSRLSDPGVRRAVDRWLDQVAAGLCTLIHAYNIPCLVLGGGVMEQTYAIEGARRRVLERIIPGFMGVRIVGAQLGNTAGLYGAASLARQLLEEKGRG